MSVNSTSSESLRVLENLACLKSLADSDRSDQRDYLLHGEWLPSTSALTKALLNDTAKNLKRIKNKNKRLEALKGKGVTKARTTENMEPQGDFQGIIILYAGSKDDRIQAKSYAHLVTNMLSETHTTKYHIYFSDASLRDGLNKAAAGIVWRESGSPLGWVGQGKHFFPSTPKSQSQSILAELFAISCALKKATREITQTEEWSPKAQEVLIFSDSQPALNTIRKFRSCWDSEQILGYDRYALLQSIMASDDVLKNLGVKLELHWVPGHCGVGGNVLADRIAKCSVESPLATISTDKIWKQKWK